MGTFSFTGLAAANTLTINFAGILDWPMVVATETRLIFDAGDRYLRLEGTGFFADSTLDAMHYNFDGRVTRLAWTGTATGGDVTLNASNLRLNMDFLAQILLAGQQNTIRACVFTHEDLLIGTAGDDVLASFKNNDTLTGREGNDTLLGGRDADKLFGGFGRDDLQGEYGADTLVGGRGNDRLSGGPGYDVFLFNIEPLLDGTDVMTDFSTSDQIALDNAVFPGLGAEGQLTAAGFRRGALAVDSSDRIMFDYRTRTLIYDADGIGGVDGIIVARFAANVNIYYRDFDIV